MTDITALDEVQAAEADYQAAEQNLADLEEKFATGQGVTPAQFEKAEQRKSMAGRMIERMRHRKAVREQTEHDQQVQALHAEWLEWIATSDLEDARTAYAAYVDAHRTLNRRIAAYNQKAADFRRRSKQLGISDGQRHPFPDQPDAFVGIGKGTGPGFNSYPWTQIAQYEAEHNRPMDLDNGNRAHTPARRGHRLHTDARRAELAAQAAQDFTDGRERSAQRDAERIAEVAEKERARREAAAEQDAEYRRIRGYDD